MSSMRKEQKAYFAAGCFWGVEETFRKIKGVLETAVVYMGGHADNPTYESVCNGNTGHAETLEGVFDPAIISFEQLVEAFFDIHDPATLNRQGPDIGEQYRSAIFFINEEQNKSAKSIKKKLSESGRFSRPVVTEISQAGVFNRAEEYHQRYFEKRGGGTCHV